MSKLMRALACIQAAGAVVVGNIMSSSFLENWRLAHLDRDLYTWAAITLLSLMFAAIAGCLCCVGECGGSDE